MSISDDLLAFAQAALGSALEPSDQVTLRRAISAAYYATFHRFCELCADTLVGRDKEVESYIAIYRSLDHGPVKATLNQMKVMYPDLSNVSDNFRELQDARYWADYDPSPKRKGDSAESFPLEKAVELIERARETLVAVDGLDKEKSLRLAAQFIANPRVKARQAN